MDTPKIDMDCDLQGCGSDTCASCVRMSNMPPNLFASECASRPCKDPKMCATLGACAKTPVETADTKPTNPKDMIGSSKLPLHLWPTTATALGCLGLLDGELKYGRSNFREIGVRASIYYDAARRHLDAWFEGEDNAPDNGIPHLAHALACVAIIVDAEAAGKLNDDRMVRGGYRQLIETLTPHVNRLKQLHSASKPKHYSIADNQ